VINLRVGFLVPAKQVVAVNANGLDTAHAAVKAPMRTIPIL